jgi:hypothetical protein
MKRRGGGDNDDGSSSVGKNNFFNKERLTYLQSCLYYDIIGLLNNFYDEII